MRCVSGGAWTVLGDGTPTEIEEPIARFAVGLDRACVALRS